MSNVEQPSIQDLAAAYALGALDREEARAFEALLETSEEARREVAGYREVSALLALGAGGELPDPALRARILDRIRHDKVAVLPSRAGGRTTPNAWLMRAALAASLLAVIGLGLATWNLNQRVAARNAAIDSLRVVLAAREERLADREATLNELLEPEVQLHNFAATGDAKPRIQFFWNRRKNVATVHAVNLNPAPAGRTYQLWFIKDGKPVPSLTFNSAPDGHALVRNVAVPPEGVISAAAVTEEPEGGSSAPTTQPFIVGSLSS